MTSINQNIAKIRKGLPEHFSARISDEELIDHLKKEAVRDLEVKKALKKMGCHERPVYRRSIPHEKYPSKLSFYYGRKAMFYVHKSFKYGIWESTTICRGAY